MAAGQRIELTPQFANQDPDITRLQTSSNVGGGITQQNITIGGTGEFSGQTIENALVAGNFGRLFLRGETRIIDLRTGNEAGELTPQSQVTTIDETPGLTAAEQNAPKVVPGTDQTQPSSF